MKLLIIDDEENMCHMLRAMIERHGYDITVAYNGKSALALVANEHFDFILCDVKMPQIDGMMFLENGQDDLRNSTVIMMSAYGSIDLAIAAMKAGAYDFISKPFKSDEVLLTLKKAEERERLKKENRHLKQKIAEIKNEKKFGRMVAVSAEMKGVITLAQKVAQYDTTILITGESGTGKELVARGIHESSPRADKPFFAINCGSLPENLLESELFGYVRGAFTGADRDTKGLFREADGSTLFLDEIGELPFSMQVKLLRVLQEQEVQPIGSPKTKKINVRLLAATAKDLREQVKLGAFREDLFYRLNVIHVVIPPLRDRLGDIPPLCDHFIAKFNKILQVKVDSLAPNVLRALLQNKWPGNVRELENIIQRGMVLSQSGDIDLEHIPSRLRHPQSGERVPGFCETEELSIKSAQKILEKKLINKALILEGGNKSRASKILEISYPSLLSKIKEYHL